MIKYTNLKLQWCYKGWDCLNIIIREKTLISEKVLWKYFKIIKNISPYQVFVNKIDEERVFNLLNKLNGLLMSCKKSTIQLNLNIFLQ